MDFSQWVQSGAVVTGIDLTKAAISHTKERLDVLGLGNLGYKLCQGDAESLPFRNMLFDLVYAWGVFHHTPDTLKAFQEAFRVLKTGGTLKAMIYHVPSWTGWMLWFCYGLLKGRPLLSPRVAIFNYLESPSTKAYTIREAKKMLLYCGFKNISVKTKLSVSDLLNIKPSNRYQGLIFGLIWKIYPRWLVRFLGDQLATALLIKTRK